MSHIGYHEQAEHEEYEREMNRQRKIEEYWADASVSPLAFHPIDFDEDGNPIWYTEDSSIF